MTTHSRLMEFVFRNGESRFWPMGQWNRLEGSALVPLDWGPRGTLQVAYIYANDGCSKSPDFWRGKELWPACVIHDRDYATLRSADNQQFFYALRLEADQRFNRNLRTVLRQQGMNRFSAWIIARIYYRAVRKFGEGSARG